MSILSRALSMSRQRCYCICTARRGVLMINCVIITWNYYPVFINNRSHFGKINLRPWKQCLLQRKCENSILFSHFQNSAFPAFFWKCHALRKVLRNFLWFAPLRRKKEKYHQKVTTEPEVSLYKCVYSYTFILDCTYLCISHRHFIKVSAVNCTADVNMIRLTVEQRILCVQLFYENTRSFMTVRKITLTYV